MSDAFGTNHTIYWSATPITVAGAAILESEIRGAALTADTGQTQSVDPGRSRSTSEYKKRAGTFQSVGSLAQTMSLQAVVDYEDPLYIALIDAMNNGTVIAVGDFIQKDGVKTAAIDVDTRGLGGNWYVTEMGDPRPEDGVTTMSVSLTPVAGQVTDLT